MNISKIILAGTATVLIQSAAWADDQTGMVTQIDRLNHTIAIQQAQSGGTVGANSDSAPTGPANQFKTEDGVSLDDVHAGDRVSFSLKDGDGAKTITKLQRQK